MLLPFRLGIGGAIGTGRQYVSWIDLDDLVAAIAHVMSHPDCQGPLNAVAPQPVTNREFTRALGRVLRRPTVLPLPAFVARLVLGEMADQLLLASTRVEPACLLASGFEFGYPQLEQSLRHVLGRPALRAKKRVSQKVVVGLPEAKDTARGDVVEHRQSRD